MSRRFVSLLMILFAVGAATAQDVRAYFIEAFASIPYLTPVLRSVRACVSAGERLPGERFVYLGDTARVPYGTKSLSTVERYAIVITGAPGNTFITHFSVETAGHFDLESELKIWISGQSEPVQKTFTRGQTIFEVQKALATYVGR